MIYLIIWFLRELAPKLRKLKNKMETDYSCKIQKKRYKKVGKSQSIKKEKSKRNIIKQILNQMKIRKWNMVHMILNLEIMKIRKNSPSMKIGNINYKRNKWKTNLTRWNTCLIVDLTSLSTVMDQNEMPLTFSIRDNFQIEKQSFLMLITMVAQWNLLLKKSQIGLQIMFSMVNWKTKLRSFLRMLRFMSRSITLNVNS